MTRFALLLTTLALALSSAAGQEIAPESAARLHLKWKLRLASRPRELTNLTTPRMAQGMVIVAGASNTLDIVDAASGKLLRHLQFPEAAAPQHPPSWICPNALNAAPAIEMRGTVAVAHVLTADGRLHSVDLRTGEESPPAAFVPPFSKAWSLSIDKGVIYTATSQGCAGEPNGVYSLELADPEHRVHFFATAPAGAGIWGASGVTVAEGTVFASTGDGAFDPDQGSYGNSVIALRGPALELRDYFTPMNWEQLDRKDLDMGSISPLAFPAAGGQLVAASGRQLVAASGRQLVAASGKDGRVFLLSADSLGGQRHQTPLFETPVLVNSGQSSAGGGFWGSFASWESPEHIRYLYAPAWGSTEQFAHGAILAFRVEDRAGTPALVAAWTSRDLNVPASPVASNGVLFALSSGEQSAQFDKSGRQFQTAERIRTAGRAILYAFDAQTGRELFNSGSAMRSFTHRNGIAVSGNRVFVATYDSMLYCFGL